MTESPSPLTMRFSRHTRRLIFIAGLGAAGVARLRLRHSGYRDKYITVPAENRPILSGEEQLRRGC
jgi:hypothetical protein